MNDTDLVIAERLRAAAAALAQVCDGARKRDDVGFSASDTAYGRAIAWTPAEQWTELDCLAVSALLHRYRGQLEGMGFSLADIPWVIDQVDRESNYREFKERAEAARELRMRDAYARNEITRQQVESAAPYLAWVDRRMLAIRSPRDADLIAAIKAMPGRRRWNGDERRWEVELSPENARALPSLIAEFEILISDADLDLVAAARTAQTVAAPGAVLREHITVEDGKFVLATPYNPQATAAIKEILGRAWVAPKKVWTVPISKGALATIREMAGRYGWHASEATWAAAEHVVTGKAANVVASKAADADVALVGMEDGVTPYPYQRAGIAYAMRQRRVLIADDMGCISGSAILTCNRAGKGFKITLRDLYRKFNGIAGTWRKDILTRTRSLVDGEIRLNDIVAVLYKGEQRVLRVILAFGKSVVCTPDHEISTGMDAWTRADALMVGGIVLTNGVAACRLCGSTSGVSAYKYAKFPGVCRKCMYRKMRRSLRKDGRIVDKDGYVRVTGQQDHPRVNKAGQVYEHILVMEEHLGRAIGRDEDIHHVNGDSADNRVENLRVMSRSEHFITDHRHCNLHGGVRRGSDVIFRPIEDRVIAIEEAGTTDVYDVVMADPARNFVADRVIVHNCGKTPQALLTVAQLDAFPALVVVPKSVVRQWAHETKKFLKGRTASIVGLKGNAKRLARQGLVAGLGGDVVIVNYERLNALVDKIDVTPKPAPGMPEPKKKYEWPLRPEARPFRSLILDESHFCKNSRVDRSRRAKALATKDGLACTILLTGTPVLNRPIELTHQLDILGRLGEFGGFMGFCKRYCAAHETKYGWDMSGASNMAELNTLLRERCMVRREKADVLAELPALRRASVPVEVDDPRAYRDAIRDVVAWMAANRGTFPSEEAYRAEALVKIEGLRQLAARSKYASGLEWLTTWLEAAEGQKLVLFAHHRDIQEKLKADLAAFGAVSISGGDSDDNRDAAVKRFWDDPTCRVIVCSIKAASVGLNLQCATNVAFFEFAWHAADMDQAEARCHRIGVSAAVMSYWLIGEDTFDEDMVALIEEKRSVASAVVSGEGGGKGVNVVDWFARLAAERTREPWEDEKTS